MWGWVTKPIPYLKDSQMNRKDELKTELVAALSKPHGTILTVSGSEPGRRQLAIAALINAKRELLPDMPELINITIKPVPSNPDEIAIIRLRPGEFLDV